MILFIWVLDVVEEYDNSFSFFAFFLVTISYLSRQIIINRGKTLRVSLQFV